MKHCDNEQLRQDVMACLRGDSEINDSHVTVHCDDGTVSLDGSIDTLWKKKQVENLVCGVEGVGVVENRLAVVPTNKQDDRKIADDIVTALDCNALVEAKKMDIKVRNGEVTLHGTVPGWLTWRAVCDAVERTPGVRAFKNELDSSPVA